MEAEIVIEGNVGQAVEWRDHDVYGGCATFNVAVTPGYRKDDKWHDQETMWFRVSCWRQFGASVRDSLKKGDAVVVKGYLRIDRWVDDKGQARQSFSVNATRVGHDLRRGRAHFERIGRPQPEEPQRLTESERDRLAALEVQYADLHLGTHEEGHIDADGVVHEAPQPVG